jgi:AhpD family alkylhydroperoxidase
MSENVFVEHTMQSAPIASRRSMEATVKSLGYLPAGVGRLASSPHLLEGFQKMNGLFDATTLDPVAREVVIMTIATRNACHLCVAMHTAKLIKVGASAELVAGLRSQRPLDDSRLEAVRMFTLEVLANAGAVDSSATQAFLSHGYTSQNALEVVLGIGTYTLSTLANRLTHAPLDEQLVPFAWHP